MTVTEDGKVLLRSGKQLRLSPSSISAFEQCPLLFKLRHIDRKPEPATPELAAGILVHETLADLFTLPPQERRLEAAQKIFRERWREQRRSKRYGPLFGLGGENGLTPDDERPRAHVDVERERAWGLKAFETLRSYFTLESPARLSPMGCETKVAAEIPSVCATDAAIPITGTIDRIDVAEAHVEIGGADGSSNRDGSSSSDGRSSSMGDRSAGTSGNADGSSSSGRPPALVVVDYKTGKAPPPQFRNDSFFQLQIYALLLQETGRRANTLRLLFLGGGGAVFEQRMDDELLEQTRGRLREIWQRMLRAFRQDAFPPNAGRLCDWCAHRATCPAFAGTSSPPAQGDGDAPPEV